MALNASYLSRPTVTLKISNLCFDLQILGTGNWLKLKCQLSLEDELSPFGTSLGVLLSKF